MMIKNIHFLSRYILAIFAASAFWGVVSAHATCVNLEVYRCNEVPLKSGVMADVRAYRTLCSAPGGPVHETKTFEILKTNEKIEWIPLQNSRPQSWDGMILDLSMILSHDDENSEIGWVQIFYSRTEGSRFQIKYPARTDLETDSEIYLKPEQCRFDSVR